LLAILWKFRFIPSAYRELRKNLLPWRKNLGEGLAPFVLKYK
jgi:hypothetical protein